MCGGFRVWGVGFGFEGLGFRFRPKPLQRCVCVFICVCVCVYMHVLILHLYIHTCVFVNICLRPSLPIFHAHPPRARAPTHNLAGSSVSRSRSTFHKNQTLTHTHTNLASRSVSASPSTFHSTAPSSAARTLTDGSRLPAPPRRLKNLARGWALEVGADYI